MRLCKCRVESVRHDFSNFQIRNGLAPRLQGESSGNAMCSIPPLCSLQFTASLMVYHQFFFNTFVEFVFWSLICVPDSSPGGPISQKTLTNLVLTIDTKLKNSE